ncbi:hypothetical protein MMC24_005476 [Lignoscripta atroalba]|nr:hypothetical protein [Lignoscripta atroalba]
MAFRKPRLSRCSGYIYDSGASWFTKREKWLATPPPNLLLDHSEVRTTPLDLLVLGDNGQHVCGDDIFRIERASEFEHLHARLVFLHSRKNSDLVLIYRRRAFCVFPDIYDTFAIHPLIWPPFDADDAEVKVLYDTYTYRSSVAIMEAAIKNADLVKGDEWIETGDLS